MSKELIRRTANALEPYIQSVSELKTEWLRALLVRRKLRLSCVLHTTAVLCIDILCSVTPFQFFNNALMLGKTSDSEVSGRLFDLIYELNMIAPSVLLAVLPQLEFKLKVRIRACVQRIIDSR